ncbi:hypothetical protein OIDMADRAFT_21496 [Oidiodendron maius Zn]|uniref:Uncharacterized protein n=1 Tax=Oidiodendron maius (strain Zn) TaxID=913774 RepID=A0A0C3GR10_OIDMZ|nr:hypothetical protein OIDMADRAFT_21496 [Oidiodendron maius Zn]
MLISGLSISAGKLVSDTRFRSTACREAQYHQLRVSGESCGIWLYDQPLQMNQLESGSCLNSYGLIPEIPSILFTLLYDSYESFGRNHVQVEDWI